MITRVIVLSLAAALLPESCTFLGSGSGGGSIEWEVADATCAAPVDAAPDVVDVDAGVDADAGPPRCPLPIAERIVAAGDSLTAGTYPNVSYPTYLSVALDQIVKTWAYGGSGVTPVAPWPASMVLPEPGYTSLHTTVIIGFGTVDIIYGAAPQAIMDGLATYIAGLVAQGFAYRVLQVPRMHMLNADMQTRRVALNAMLAATYFAPPLHPEYGDSANTKDMAWYVADDVHLRTAALKLRALEARDALERCP